MDPKTIPEENKKESKSKKLSGIRSKSFQKGGSSRSGEIIYGSEKRLPHQESKDKTFFKKQMISKKKKEKSKTAESEVKMMLDIKNEQK